jgi:hypothetical protein
MVNLFAAMKYFWRNRAAENLNTVRKTALYFLRKEELPEKPYFFWLQDFSGSLVMHSTVVPFLSI